MDDVRAVMDAAESHRAAFYGLSEGAAMSILFAATYPERTGALVVRSCSPGRCGRLIFSGAVARASINARSTRRCASTPSGRGPRGGEGTRDAGLCEVEAFIDFVR